MTDRLDENGSENGNPLAAQIRSRAFGDVAEPVRVGRLARAEALVIMTRAVEQLYPDCVCAFGHGSAITGQFSKYSDLDVVIFMKEGNFFEVSCSNFEGYLIEAQIYSLDTLDVFLMISKSAGLSIGMMAGCGEPLVDQDGVADALLRKLTEAYHTGPDAASDQVCQALRVKLTNLVIDLLEAGDANERISCGLTLFELMNRANFMVQRSWSHAGKWIPRQSPEYFRDLVAAYENIFRDDAEPLAALALRLLDELGGPRWTGYSTRIGVMPDLVIGGALSAMATLARG